MKETTTDEGTRIPAFDEFFAGLRPEAPQVVPGLTIIPFTSSLTPGPSYLPLSEALAKGLVKITEVSEGGQVPDLAVVNLGDIPALLLAGEEVAGAKQNRVFNTTILVEARSKLRVPVSCTEAGRWSYRSRHFSDSGHMAPKTIRARKSASVHQSLKREARHFSDQSMLWDDVSAFNALHSVRSPTGALRDSLEQRRRDAESPLKKLTLVPEQIGLIAVGPDGFVGIEAVSQPGVYAALHDKLVRSYLYEVMGNEGEVKLNGQVDAFLSGLKASGRAEFQSPGKGMDIRLDGGKLGGSALQCEQEIIHLTAFTKVGG
jgi:hypothetical protein